MQMIRCTQKLLNELGEQPDAQLSVMPGQSWHANL